MKRVFLSITSIFMITAILANTAGITIYPHFCKEDGELSLNLYKKDNCCDDKHQEVKAEKKHACCQKNKSSKEIFQDKKDNCCKQESFTAQWKLNEFSFDKKFQIVVPFNFIQKNFHFVLIPEQNTFVNTKTESPPLYFNGREILVYNQTFLI